MSDTEFSVSSNSGKSETLSCTSYSKWCEFHPQLLQFLEALVFRNNIPTAQINAKRQGTHNRCSDMIYSYIKNLESLVLKTEQELIRLSAIPDQQIEFLGYNENWKNMETRKLAYVNRKIHLQKIDLLSRKFGVIGDVLKDARSLLRLFTSKIIPKNTVLRIKPTFFETFNKEDLNLKEKHIIMLSSYRKKLEEEVKNFEKPLWSSDFVKFMKNTSAKALMHVDNELSYFHSLDEEIALSRALFTNRTKQRMLIDEYLNSEIRFSDPIEYVMGIIDISEELIPKEIDNHDQESVCVLLLFRALFNRVYEKFPDDFAKQRNPEMERVDKMKKIPAALYVIPLELVRTKPFGTMEEFFKGDPFFVAAAQFLSQSIFMSNPIDMLYCIHKCMNGIQKGALIRRIGPNADAKIEDMKELICFDDLFSLLVGTLMASDIPDIFYVTDFVKRFSPKSSLSPPFEYALVNIEALVSFCKKTNIEELQKKAEEISK